MRWLVAIAVVALVGLTAAAVFEPQVKRFFGDCHQHGFSGEVRVQSFTGYGHLSQLRNGC